MYIISNLQPPSVQREALFSEAFFCNSYIFVRGMQKAVKEGACV